MAKKSLIGGTLILMVAGFIVRVMGFLYRIYLSNLIGAEGMGLFQLISPVYSLIILTLTSGISVAVSKMVAEEMAKAHYINLRRITKCAFILVTIAGTAVSALIVVFINPIVTYILKDSRTYLSMLLLVPSIPVIAAASAIKGYFYGIQNVTPTAISQVVEQIVRITIVMILAAYFANVGLEYACALATIGMALGEISNLAVVAVVYKLEKRRFPIRSKTGMMRKRTIVKNLLKMAVPVSFNRFITSIMSAAEYILIPARLLAGGLDYRQSLIEYGKLTGMAMPLLFFPSLVTSSLATTLVPAISEAMSLKNYKLANYRISKCIQLTFILGFIFTAIFLRFPNEIGSIIYRNENIGPMLYMLSFTCIFTYLHQTLLGTLNGLGKQNVSLRNSIIANSIRIGFVYFFVPAYGIKGYIWGLVISTSVVCILDFYTVIKSTGMVLDFRNWIIKPGIVCALIYFSGSFIQGFVSIFGFGYNLTVILTIITGVLVAIGMMYVVGVLEKEEIVRLIKR